MKSYSAVARAFIGLVYLLGLIALVSALAGPILPGDKFAPLPTLLAMTAAGIAGTRKIYLLRTTERGQSRYVTLGFLVTFATLLALGVRAGVLAGVVSALCADLYTYSYAACEKRLFPHQILFNMASIAITAWGAGHVFAALNSGIGHIESRSLRAVMMSMLCYFLLNTGSLACVLSLCSRQRFLAVWRANFWWAFPLHLMGAAYVALAIIFIHDTALIILAASVTPFAYQYYKMYGDHVAQKQTLIEELQAGREMLSDLYLSTVKSLATAIAAKDQYTHDHIHRVQGYAVAVARKLGVSGDEMEAIRTGAVLHDIGKLGVPDYVLLKQGDLTADDRAKINRHPEIGADILEPVNFPWPVVGVVRHHHERWDGKGYPDGLAGAAIPLGARILTVADVYDALTTDRPYRAAWSHAETEAYLIAQAGIQFDPAVVTAFVQVMGETADTLPRGENGAQSRQVQDGDGASSASSQTSRQIGRTASELWVLYEVSSTLGSAAPMQKRLESLGGKLTSIRPGTTCAFELYDTPENTECGIGDAPEPQTGGARLRLMAAAGANAERLSARPLDEGDAPWAVAARQGKPYRGAYSDLLPALSPSASTENALQSVLIVPLRADASGGEGQTLGVMAFYHTAPDAFTSDDENLLTMIADQVQAALCQNREHDQTRSEANTDALTGLHNMRYLRETTDALLASADPSRRADFALLYLDLDNFKNVNTIYGHPTGSRVLSDVARLLPRELRPSDVAVRYGGDEFVIILPLTSEGGARDVADRIRAAIRGYRPAFMTEWDAACHLDVSIGIACCPGDCAGMEELVAVADQRMYEKKMAQKGLNHVPDMRYAAAVPLPLDPLSSDPLSLDTLLLEPVLEPALPEPIPLDTLSLEALLQSWAGEQSLCLDTAVVASVLQRWPGTRFSAVAVQEQE